jgi:hypothetical protein
VLHLEWNILYKRNPPEVVSVSELLITGSIQWEEAQIIARNERNWDNNLWQEISVMSFIPCNIFRAKF